jgi:hypothetical protein
MTPPTTLAVGTELLRASLQVSADALYRRRASEIPEGYIDEYVRLHWLEWHGGGLRLTPTGENICRQTSAGAQQP